MSLLSKWSIYKTVTALRQKFILKLSWVDTRGPKQMVELCYDETTGVDHTTNIDYNTVYSIILLMMMLLVCSLVQNFEKRPSKEICAYVI